MHSLSACQLVPEKQTVCIRILSGSNFQGKDIAYYENPLVLWCNLCARTCVTHVPGLYRGEGWGEGVLMLLLPFTLGSVKTYQGRIGVHMERFQEIHPHPSPLPSRERGHPRCGEGYAKVSSRWQNDSAPLTRDVRMSPRKDKKEIECRYTQSPFSESRHSFSVTLDHAAVPLVIQPEAAEGTGTILAPAVYDAVSSLVAAPPF